MTNKLAEAINKLEILYTEQEYTIDSLNETVSRQSAELSQIKLAMEILTQQIKQLKQQLPEQNPVDEKPPHY